MGRLAGKVCLITGSGGSMGRAAARMFAAEGAVVVGCDIDASSAEETIAHVRRHGFEMSSIHPRDLADPLNSRSLADEIVARWGRIDVLYNNGGAAAMAWIADMTPEQWSFTLRNELDLVFFATQAVWPHMKAQQNGSIINIGSVSGKRAYEVLPAVAHSAGKGGVIALTRHLAMEGGPHNIRVNSISPGLIVTQGTTPLLEDPEWSRTMLAKIMLKKPGMPEDVVAAAIFLASDEARWITGADFAVDGGTTAW